MKLIELKVWLLFNLIPEQFWAQSRIGARQTCGTFPLDEKINLKEGKLESRTDHGNKKGTTDFLYCPLMWACRDSNPKPSDP
jgi:hypothetical protein